MVRLFALALILGGCALPADLVRLEQPGPAYVCAAWLMGEDAPGPVPTLRYAELRYSDGFYDSEANEIVVRRFYNIDKALWIIGHEAAHAVQAHNGMAFDERWADYVGRRMRDCINLTP